MRVLGLSAFQRDSAAALVIDGEVRAAMQEERLTRLAADKAFPTRAIRNVLNAGDVLARDLDRVVFYEKPLRKFERLLVNNLRAFPRSARSFSQGLFLWLGDRLWIRNRIAADLEIAPENVIFAEHLQSLAAAAFLTSPFDEAAVLVVDDVGEWATTLLAHGRGTTLQPLVEILHPHSLGLVASAVTQFLGFIPGEEEDKVEALAAWGEPRFLDQLERLVPAADGFFRVDASVFRFGYDSDRLYEDALLELFGPPRFPGQPLRYLDADRRDADLAASLQVLLEDRVLCLARNLAQRTGCARLCFAGALANNRTLLARLHRDAPFDEIRVPVASGKSGGAIGAALLAEPSRGHAQAHLGSTLLHVAGDPADRALLEGELSARLADGETLAWMDGALEFGPRSLAARIVLRDARGDQASRALLSACQHVEAFLPVRVAVPMEERERFFELSQETSRAATRAQVFARATPELGEHAPSAILPNGLAWPQLVESDAHPKLHALLIEHGSRTGTPVLLLTDFRLRGAPLIASAMDAVEAFRRTNLSALAIGEELYERGAAGS